MNETEIRIRRAEPGDAAAVYEIFTGPRAVWGTLQLPFPGLEEWKGRLERPSEGTYNLVAVVEGTVVGMLGLHGFPSRPRRRHVVTLGMTVHDAWAGRGVGSALMAAAVELADNWLNVRRMELEVYVDNEPAIRLYRRFGFEVEGTARDHSFRNGEYVDSLLMARLRTGAPR